MKFYAVERLVLVERFSPRGRSLFDRMQQSFVAGFTQRSLVVSGRSNDGWIFVLRPYGKYSELKWRLDRK